MASLPTDRSQHEADRPVAVVNGQVRPLDGVTAQTNALDWLRACGLTGAKEGCAEGECGACAILVARPDGDGTQWTALNACLVPAAALDGQEVVTSEGLGTPQGLHPVQRELAARGGSQCGYCTPGFVCALAAEYYRADRVTRPNGSVATPPTNTVPYAAEPAQRHTPSSQPSPSGPRPEPGPNGFDLHALSGNLCRCTGYRPIRDAAQALGAPLDGDELATRRGRPAPAARATRFTTATGTYARAHDLADAFALLAEHPEAVVVAGSTDWGVEVNLKGARARFAIGIDRVPELRAFEVSGSLVEIGAALTLSEVEALLGDRVPILSQLWPQFASRLIRNAATIGGNLATASPIGDLAPALLALEADVVLVGAQGSRAVPIADYFTGYRQTVRRPDELIRSVRIPLPPSGISAFHKIAKRRFDDISSVAMGFAIVVDHGLVSRARIGLGGVAATPVRARLTEAALEGGPWTRDHVARAAEVLRHEGTPLDDHRASSAYRSAMLGTALLRLHAQSPRPTEVAL